MEAVTPDPNPVIAVGTHRSGTTFLGQVLEQHPDVAFWEEPRHVWVRGNASRPDDVLTAADARPAVVRSIRRRFAEHQRRLGKPRFAEKTPSNCLRLPFVDAVFPNAIYVHIYRDGRAVVNSTARLLERATPNRAAMVQRLLGTPPWEWPAYANRFAHTVWAKLRGGRMSFWGPRPPGWQGWLEAGDPPSVVLAKQWRCTIEPVLEFRERVEPERWLDFRYEDLASDPRGHVARILEHCGLEQRPEVLDFVEERTDRSRAEGWRSELGGDSLEEMRPILEPALERLGYDW